MTCVSGQSDPPANPFFFRIQRLQPGGVYHVPDCVSEGDSSDPPPIYSAHPDMNREIAPSGQSPRFTAHDGMNREIARLHALGRSGALDAEPHLNAFLAAARAGDPRYRMPLADAPQFGNLPDLWRFVHSAIVGSNGTGLELLIRQALPCFKRPEAQLPPLESAGPVAISLILGLLLGLYPDATCRPQFAEKINIFARAHAELVAPDGGAAFVAAHPALVTLAMVE